MTAEVERSVERIVPGGNIRPDGTQVLSGRVRVIAKIESRAHRDAAWLHDAEDGVWKTPTENPQ